MKVHGKNLRGAKHLQIEIPQCLEIRAWEANELYHSSSILANYPAGDIENKIVFVR